MLKSSRTDNKGRNTTIICGRKIIIRLEIEITTTVITELEGRMQTASIIYIFGRQCIGMDMKPVLRTLAIKSNPSCTYLINLYISLSHHPLFLFPQHLTIQTPSSNPNHISTTPFIQRLSALKPPSLPPPPQEKARLDRSNLAQPSPAQPSSNV